MFKKICIHFFAAIILLATGFLFGKFGNSGGAESIDSGVRAVESGIDGSQDAVDGIAEVRGRESKRIEELESENRDLRREAAESRRIIERLESRQSGDSILISDSIEGVAKSKDRAEGIESRLRGLLEEVESMENGGDY